MQHIGIEKSMLLFLRYVVNTILHVNVVCKVHSYFACTSMIMRVMCRSLSLYTYIYIYVYMCIYIYIYRERDTICVLCIYIITYIHTLYACSVHLHSITHLLSLTSLRLLTSRPCAGFVIAVCGGGMGSDRRARHGVAHVVCHAMPCGAVPCGAVRCGAVL